MTGVFGVIVLVLLSYYWLLWLRRQLKTYNGSSVARAVALAAADGTSEINGVDLGIFGRKFYFLTK